jgi:curli biogenesis system outer membrane secretion channel CsgG
MHFYKRFFFISILLLITISNLYSNHGIEEVIKTAIDEATNNITDRSPIIAIVDITAANPNLRDFISGESEFLLVSKGFRVVDRGQLDRIRAEQRFQTSGEVDEHTSAEIGKIAGADYILTGSVTGTGDLQRLRFRILDTQTADVIGTASQPFGDSKPLPSPLNIDNAIIRAVEQATSRIEKNTKLAIVQVTTETVIRDFVAGESEFHLVRSGYRVVDRAELDRIRAEQRMQLSGEIDDQTVVSFGRLAGADYIITIRTDRGSGPLTRLRWRVLDTQTALVVGVASIPYHGNISHKNSQTGLENAMIEAIKQATPNVTKQSRIAIVQIIASDSNHREFVANETENILVNSGFRVTDRAQLDKIRAEQGFQRSGEVDDRTAVDIGKFAGAGYIITGRIDGAGSLRRLRLRFLDTQTAEVVGSASVRF